MIKNFYKTPATLIKNIHDGEGVVRVSDVFENFATPVQFFHYTVLPPGTSIGTHEHGNDEEFYVVLAGTGEMKLGGENHQVIAGDVIKNPPYGTHGLRNTSDTDDLQILVFEVKV